ncbi:DUF2480 family protein [Flavicella sediminum]|uniref:DUF2480 family protein n=1 Tax=Flavicella sediminum TaxID=2585141 RepID=UPI00111D9C0C|nr:DUF2480 family protein [Flavicella sediminum]
MEEIINKVANSKLKTIDLEDFYPEGKRVVFDIKQWLFQELILKEKDFRASIDAYDWSTLQDSFVALTCSADAIIPSWAYLLITTRAAPFAKKIIVGDLELLENSIFQEVISKMDFSSYQNLPVIIKGCANKPIPESAYTYLIQCLVPVANNIMYGEACSTVPLYKKKK